MMRNIGKRRSLHLQMPASWTLRAMLAALGLSLTLLSGQSPPATRPKLAEGERSYAKQCAGCHGADAHGTDRGPGLAGNRRVRSRSAEQLRAFIRKGSPGGGMPP